MRHLMWNGPAKVFCDYLWEQERPSDTISAATVFPLYFGIATEAQAHAVAASLRRTLLEPGASAQRTCGAGSNEIVLMAGRPCSGSLSTASPPMAGTASRAISRAAGYAGTSTPMRNRVYSWRNTMLRSGQP